MLFPDPIPFQTVEMWGNPLKVMLQMFIAVFTSFNDVCYGQDIRKAAEGIYIFDTENIIIYVCVIVVTWSGLLHGSLCLFLLIQLIPYTYLVLHSMFVLQFYIEFYLFCMLRSLYFLIIFCSLFVVLFCYIFIVFFLRHFSYFLKSSILRVHLRYQ